MGRLGLALLILCSACGPVAQPESLRTVAALEVPLSTAPERGEFLEILRRTAAAEGLHVDASTDAELEQLSETPMTINASVWRGANDDEIIASVMDLTGNSGRAWLTYSRGEDLDLSRRFRERSLREILARWPAARRLPILPDGGLPLPGDLRWTEHGYRVEPSAAAAYELSPTSPLVVRDTGRR
jgi:hypothetical protein